MLILDLNPTETSDSWQPLTLEVVIKSPKTFPREQSEVGMLQHGYCACEMSHIVHVQIDILVLNFFLVKVFDRDEPWHKLFFPEQSTGRINIFCHNFHIVSHMLVIHLNRALLILKQIKRFDELERFTDLFMNSMDNDLINCQLRTFFKLFLLFLILIIFMFFIIFMFLYVLVLFNVLVRFDVFMGFNVLKVLMEFSWVSDCSWCFL